MPSRPPKRFDPRAALARISRRFLGFTVHASRDLAPYYLTGLAMIQSCIRQLDAEAAAQKTDWWLSPERIQQRQENAGLRFARAHEQEIRDATTDRLIGALLKLENDDPGSRAIARVVRTELSRRMCPAVLEAAMAAIRSQQELR